jgi:dTMP kinase
VTESVGGGDGHAGTLTRLFGSPSYFRLWFSQAVSSLGDWIGLVAVIAIATRVGGGNSGTAIGLVLSARVAPGLFLGSFLGVLADRLDRKRTMVFCDIGRGLVLLALPFVKDVPGLILASLLLELFTLLWSSAKEASVPNLVEQAFLPNANSLSLAAAYGTFPISAAAFAGLVRLANEFSGTFGVHKLAQESLAIWFDVGTFFLSALTITTLALPHRATSAVPTEGTLDVGRVFRDVREGFRLIRSNNVVRAVLIGLTCGLAGGGAVVPLGSVFSKQVLGAGSAGFGVLLTVLGVGVAAGVIGVTVVQKRIPHSRAFVAVVYGGGAFLIAAASTSSLWLASVCAVGLGICGGAVYVLGFSLLQSEVSDELRGRVFATLYTSTRLSLFLALLIPGFVSDRIDGLSKLLFGRRISIGNATLHLPGVRLTLWLAGVVILVAGLLAQRSLRSAPPKASSEPPSRSSAGSAE